MLRQSEVKNVIEVEICHVRELVVVIEVEIAVIGYRLSVIEI